MARTIGSLVGVSKPTEMLLLTLAALWVNVFDMTLFELGSNLDQVWKAPIADEKVSAPMQNLVRLLLSGVVFVRTFTLHLYIAFLIAMFWPLYFGTRPTLMLPWLLVSAIKNIGTGLISSFTGIYTCVLYGPMRPACLKFLGTQILDLGPTFYMWVLGISLYRDLSKPPTVDKIFIKLSEEEEHNQALRRRKVKSLSGGDETKRIEPEKFTAEDGVQELFIPESSAKMSRSLDSLLDVINAEVEMMDLEEELQDMEGLKPKEQTKKLLGITDSEIDRIREHKELHIDLPFQFNKMQQSESPVKLLPSTNLYCPPKPLRPTKSELKSPREIHKIKIPSDFTIPTATSEHQIQSPTITSSEMEKETNSYNLSKTSDTETEIETVNFSADKISSGNFYSDYGDDKKMNKSDSACQVSTLSKKVLEASAKEMTEKLRKKSKITNISIQPPDSLLPRNKPKFPRTPVSKSTPTSSRSGREPSKLPQYSRENSYLGIHLHKRELEKTFDNTKLAVDKFGIKNEEENKDGSKRKFSNVTVKL